MWLRQQVLHGSSEAAESSETESVAEDDLAATSYVASNVEGRDLVAGSEILLVFELGTMTATAGCNIMFGGYEIDDGLLRWSDAPAQTQRACRDEAAAQDDWLTNLLTEGASASFEGDDLVLTSGEVRIELTEKSAAQADLSSLLGRTWTVVGTITEGETQRLARGNRPPRLGVRATGLSRLNTGCNVGRTVVRVRDDAFEFGPTTTTRQACRQPERETERRVLAVLDGRTDDVYTHGATLVVKKGDYGLVVQVS